jgi:hypothetical protein
MPSTPKIPETVSPDNRVQIVGRMLNQLQTALFTLGVEQTVNGLADTDPAVLPDGQPGPRTVEQERAHLNAAIDRLAHEYSDLWGQVTALFGPQ